MKEVKMHQCTCQKSPPSSSVQITPRADKVPVDEVQTCVVAISRKSNLSPRVISIHEDTDGNGGPRHNSAFFTLPIGQGRRGVRIAGIAGVCGAALHTSSEDGGMMND